MRKILLFISVFTFMYSQGIVEYGSFHSESLDETKNYTIYLPEEYYESNENYPVVYFLHGFGGDNNSYNTIHGRLNTLTYSDQIIDMIVVSADGSTDTYDGSFYTNSVLNGDYEDYIVYDLVNYIDEQYNTLNSRNFRALSGHSMGGYGAFRLGMRNSDMFASFASHSGPIHLENLNNPFLIQMVLIEAFFGDLDPNNGPTSMMLFGLSSAFSPNLDNPPYYVDLPIDNSGNVNWDVFEMWQAHDPYLLVDEYVETLHEQNIYFDCGNNDELQLYNHSTDMDAKLDDLGILHSWQSYSGNHSSHIYDRTEVSFVFHSDYFSSQNQYMQGDINFDEVINVLDVVLLVNFILGISSPESVQFEVSDMNFDGSLNVQDIIILINEILG